MDVKIGLKTDAGKRDNNEDAVLVLKPKVGQMGADVVLVVADGMGGRAAGEEASALAVATVRETLQALLIPDANMPSYSDAMATAMRRANNAVYELARSKPGQKGMGTTCVAAILGRDEVTIGHVGDSRAYLLRDGLLRRLTEDHSYVHDQLKTGNLSDHDARNSRFRHVITKAIGIEPSVEPDILTYPVHTGDSLLICTDGMSNVVDESGMIQIISRAGSAQEAIDFLVDAAKRGGSKDNITGALARIGVDEPDSLFEGESSGGSYNLDGMSGVALRKSFVERAEEALSQRTADGPVPAPKPSTPAVPVLDHGKGAVNNAGRPVEAAGRVVPWVWLVGGLVLGAVLTVVSLFAAGKIGKHRPVATVQQALLQPSVESLSYAAPQQLLSTKMVGSLIAGGESGVIVTSAVDGKMYSVNSSGQVRQTGQLSNSASNGSLAKYVATDQFGYIYVTMPTDKMVRRFAPDGTFQRTIAETLLARPEAIYVDGQDDIYVIDNNYLKLIKAIPPIAGSPLSTPIGSSPQASQIQLVGGTH